jgi:hypothetical protein
MDSPVKGSEGLLQIYNAGMTGTASNFQILKDLLMNSKRVKRSLARICTTKELKGMG